MAEAGTPTGFWSYVHKDEERVGGRILRLASKIQDEFALITGQEIEIFVDRDSIAWGDQWGAKINTAIQETTFFIPVVTPGYFKSDACRKELLKFATYARSLGAEELLLPIYFVDVPDMNEDNPDDAIALIAGTQWADWRELRLVDENSEQHARAVNDLVTRLAHISTEYANRPSVVPSENALIPVAQHAVDDDEEPGLTDLLAGLEEAMPAWVETMSTFEATLERIAEVVNASTARLADDQNDTFAKRVLVARDLGRDLQEPADEFLTNSNMYASALLGMDPGVRALITLAAEQEEEEAIATATETLDSLRSLIATSKANGQPFNEFLDSLKEPSRQFKDLRPPLKKLQSGMRSMLDAHTIMDEWARLMDENPPGGLRPAP